MDYDVYFSTLLSSSENPIHAQHLLEFYDLIKLMIEQLVPSIVEKELEKYLSDAMDDRIRAQVQNALQQQRDKTKVDVEAYFNGKPATDANIVKGVRNMVLKALKRAGMGR